MQARRLGIALAALLSIALAWWQLQAAGAVARVSAISIGHTPATVFRPLDAKPHPVVVIAHGFAGSQQLMQSFALALAGNGYIAVTFDFPGHGRNPRPLTGSITQLDGATQRLLACLTDVASHARGLGDGRLAVLGHSMASDIVVRYAQSHADVAATVAVSMFSPAVTASAPANLLIIVGDWEGFLKREALRAVGLATAPASAQPGVTYGEFARGSARRVAFSAHVEHASVLFSQDSLREALDWLDQAFGTQRSAPIVLSARGPWIMLLIASVVALAAPLARLLPRIAEPRIGAGLGWRQLWLPLLAPMLATPLLLHKLPIHILPVLVGDYLACHFALYGLICTLCLWWTRRLPGQAATAAAQPIPAARWRLVVAILAVSAYGAVGLAWPIDTYVTSFVAAPQRIVLVLVMGVGTLAFFLSDEWLTRGIGAARGAYASSKLAFLGSLAIAVALDFERLFFLVIIVPVILLFFLVYGLFSRWTYRQTGHPAVAGVASALAFAWAIGVTFPLLAV